MCDTVLENYSDKTDSLNSVINLTICLSWWKMMSTKNENKVDSMWEIWCGSIYIKILV